MTLEDLGWNSFFENAFEQYREQNYAVMRIARENREQYIALSEAGEFSCEVSGKFRYEATVKSDFPAVGDWVVTSVLPGENKAVIHTVLPRKSAFSRNAAGEKTEEQIVAANINTVFIVTGLDENFNLRRIERFLSLAWESGAIPVILLSKADLCEEPELRKSEVESIAVGVDVYVLSAVEHDGLENIEKYIQPGRTVAFLGSSGVGKSTIINTLLGKENQKVSEVSSLGSRGRHTTTYRELILLPQGGMVVDTPGMREVQLWGDEDTLRQTFDDIEELAQNCKFRDCRHENEPGCAVQQAIADGTLEPSRLESYFKLRKEYDYISERQTMSANAVEKSRRKDIAKSIKQLKKIRE